MLTALEFVLSHTEDQNQFASGLSMQAASKTWDQFLRLARKAVKDANTSASSSS